ncbi:MAG: hypothetical protein ACI9HK_005023 [Pirellulaceae bacterium]|jgi:hypothetical protein
MCITLTQFNSHDFRSAVQIKKHFYVLWLTSRCPTNHRDTFLLCASATSAFSTDFQSQDVWPMVFQRGETAARYWADQATVCILEMKNRPSFVR